MQRLAFPSQSNFSTTSSPMTFRIKSLKRCTLIYHDSHDDVMYLGHFLLVDNYNPDCSSSYIDALLVVCSSWGNAFAHARTGTEGGMQFLLSSFFLKNITTINISIHSYRPGIPVCRWVGFTSSPFLSKHPIVAFALARSLITMMMTKGGVQIIKMEI